MVTCIYCPSTGPFSDEHAMPRALGEFRNFPYLAERICSKCNGDIGKSEQQFARCGPEGFFRKYLGIEGRESHEKVNVFQRGSMGGKAIDFVSKHPETGVDILWEFNQEGKTVRECCQVVFIRDGEGAKPLRITPDIETTEQLRSKMLESGIEGFYPGVYVLAAPEEEDRVEGLVKGLGQGFQWLPDQKPSQIANSTINFSLTDHYFRSIAKIAFHYGLVVLPHFRGDEECFAPLKKFIKEGGVIGDFVFTISQAGGSWPTSKQWRHLVWLKYNGRIIEVCMQFFAGPIYEPTQYLVRLTQSAPFSKEVKSAAHQFVYFDSGPEGKYVGEASGL